MKQVRQRTLLLLLLTAGFVAGVVLFCVLYATKGGQWPRSPPTTMYTRTGGWLWGRSWTGTA